METPADAELLDTNVLIYALDGSSPFHAVCRAKLEAARSVDAKLCVAPQNLAEFYSLVTNPKRVAAAIRPEEALDAIEQILSLPGLDLLTVPIDIVSRWVALCRRHPVTGPGVYDLQIVAVMLANNVCKVCTFNTADFEIFPELEAKAP